MGSCSILPSSTLNNLEDVWKRADATTMNFHPSWPCSDCIAVRTTSSETEAGVQAQARSAPHSFEPLSLQSSRSACPRCEPRRGDYRPRGCAPVTDVVQAVQGDAYARITLTVREDRTDETHHCVHGSGYHLMRSTKFRYYVQHLERPRTHVQMNAA
eukprot:7390871-Prymnesium_polylepis.1